MRQEAQLHFQHGGSEEEGGRRKRKSRWGDKAASVPPPTVLLGAGPSLAPPFPLLSSTPPSSVLSSAPPSPGTFFTLFILYYRCITFIDARMDYTTTTRLVRITSSSASNLSPHSKSWVLNEFCCISIILKYNLFIIRSTCLFTVKFSLKLWFHRKAKTHLCMYNTRTSFLPNYPESAI